MPESFTKSFTQQEALPAEAIQAANRVLGGARLHRYGGSAKDPGPAAELERAFAEWQGARFCLACASGGQAIQISLLANLVGRDVPVLTNGFTLAPVPGAIHAVGARPILVEITDDLIIDCDHLVAQARSSGAKVLLLSHMRGHLADMERVVGLCSEFGILLIEDCAHTMGATFRGTRSGNFGDAACFSTQTYKHINSGEGGLFTTDDPAAMARAVILSGSYMNHEMHGTLPDLSHFETPKYELPNLSARMDNLRAAILLPQLRKLDDDVAAWNRRHQILAGALSSLSPAVVLPKPLPGASRVGSSVQFRIPDLPNRDCASLQDRLRERGVVLAWFGKGEPSGFTSSHRHWRYVDGQSLPNTDRVLSTLFDLRLPLSFSEDDCKLLGRILVDEISGIAHAGHQVAQSSRNGR